MIRPATLAAGLFALLATAAPSARAGDAPPKPSLPPAAERFAAADAKEVPDFQRHVLPLMGRLGCNTRSCHGSFQGQGGFRLSLFGYDFKMDHDALMAKDEGRVDAEAPEVSLVLQKPLEEVPHKGGKRLEPGSWAHHLLTRWIEAGAKPAKGDDHFARLEVRPSEIVFGGDGASVPLTVIAHWADGSSEDVTCLARFQTNDEGIATVDDTGKVVSAGTGDTHVVAFYDNGVSAVQVIRPVSDRVGPNYPDVPTPTKIDEHIAAKLRKLGVVPSEVCTDEEFLRRVSLDMTGTLPTPDEVKAFLADTAKDKRAKKVDELLERPTYAAWWTNKLCDILGLSPRNFQGQTGNERMARLQYDWIYRRVRENRPYDELMAGILLGTSRAPGQSYEDYMKAESAYFRADEPADFTERDSMPYFWARRNLRLPEEKALGVSYAFLGVRLECAQCHKHPFDQWTQDDFKRFQAFFEPVRYGGSREYNQTLKQLQDELGYDRKTMNNGQFQRKLNDYVRSGKPIPWQEVTVVKTNAPARKGKKLPKDAKAAVVKGTARVLGGDEVELASYDDPREPVMAWMRSPENPYFARALINRVWAGYFGKGIIDPPDDMNLANPPVNAALLDYLADEFVARKFDMKWLHRTIATSLAYQRSWKPNDTNRLDDRNFSKAAVRRLPAEVLLDAVAQATATGDAMAKVGTEVESRGFGPQAGSGYGRRGGVDYASRVFGRSARDTNCDCSRSDEPNLLQAIFLANDPEVLASLDRRDGWIGEVNARLQAGSKGQSAEAKGLADQVAQLENRMENAKRLGDKAAPGRKRLEERLAALKARQKGLDADADAAKADAAKAIDADALIAEAYLRALSRRPSADETAAARAYLDGAPDAAAGLRGMLWALVNTKEFITNH
jgi:hypothetical protein